MIGGSSGYRICNACVHNPTKLIKKFDNGIQSADIEHIRLEEIRLFPFLNDFVIFLESVCLLPFGLFLSDCMGVLVVREGVPVIVDEPYTAVLYELYPEEKPQNIRVQISRMVNKGLVTRLYKDLYYVVPLHQERTEIA